jgi:hypothetical protein
MTESGFEASMSAVIPAMVFSPVSLATARNIICGDPAGAEGSMYGAEVITELSASNVAVIATESLAPSAMNIPPPSGRATTVQRLITESLPSARLVPAQVPASAAGVNGVVAAAAAPVESVATSSFEAQAATASAHITSPAERIDMTSSSGGNLRRSTSATH